MELIVGIVCVLYLGWTVVNGLVASEKGYEGATIAVLSLIITPIFPYLFLLAVPPRIKPS